MTNPLETRPNQVPPRRRRNIGETIEWYHSTIAARIHRLFAAAALCGQWRGFNRPFRSPPHRLNAMNLDVNTLFLVTIYVEAILGLLLLFAWVQNTAIYAVACCDFAALLRAASIMLFGMYGSVSDLVSIDLANAILFTAFAVTWTGARVFDGRPAEPVYLVTGAVLWLLVCRLAIVV